MKVHHFVSSLSRRDAIGNHTLKMGEALEEVGIESLYYVDAPHLDRVGFAHLFDEYPRLKGAGDIAICQVGSYSALVNMLVARSEEVIVDYHNITPAKFFEVWDPGFARSQMEARHQLKMLAELSPFSFADSSFNAGELYDLDYREVCVLPVFFTPTHADPDPLADGLDERVTLREKHCGARWLYVGRLLPHKAPHDLILAFSAYVRTFDASATLDLVGADYSVEYTEVLKTIARSFGVENQVFFWGSVSNERLEYFYCDCDVYVSASLHEGFCVPILEAFAHAMPVVAVAAAAVPETLGKGGVLVPPERPFEFASAVNLVMRDDLLRGELIANGEIQRRQFAPERSKEILIKAISERFQ